MKLTRCVVLYVYSQIFDPLSFVQPFILQPKLLIQELCRLGLYWDDKVPSFSFPRCIVRDNAYKCTEMHVFSNASHTAYAVTCFGCFMYYDGSVILNFLFGKYKVRPVSGSLYIPRLELVAASLATRVACSVLQESNVKYEGLTYWSESTAISHLKRSSTRCFVFS